MTPGSLAWFLGILLGRREGVLQPQFILNLVLVAKWGW